MLEKTEIQQPAETFDEFDEQTYPRPLETGFDEVLNRALSRRDLMGEALTFGLATFMASAAFPKAAIAAVTDQNQFDFTPVAANSLDTVTVPTGYRWQVVLRWGDPIFKAGKAFDEASRGDAASQALAMGDNNDGMSLLEVEGHNLLVVNNEYINRKIFYGNQPDGKPQTDDEITKGKAAHGVTIVELSFDGGLEDGEWRIVQESLYNRRITADTEMELTGPAAGHPLLQTEADPAGVSVLGTMNNCGNGETPWGTYLACEENFNGYFSSTDKTLEISDEFKRYGIGVKDFGYNWALADERFDISRHPNEPNRFGYVVEIDPANPEKPAKKRTALGRFKHENAVVVLGKDDRVVVYMGDDERGEFLYRYVSNDPYVVGAPTSKLLNNGTLYAAKFYDNLKGAWLPLTPETTGMSPAAICVHTRLAASKVGATTMDRPEWVAAHPARAELYCALTNNKNRGLKPNAGGDETPVGGPNPREKNVYGQILRWLPDKGDHGASGFQWGLFALAGNPAVHKGDKAGSKNISADNMFNAPDGLAFDTQGRLWIQTDGNYSNKDDFEGMGNNQMLVGDPDTGEIRRFLVGPRESEVTGICWSPDRRTMFVGIQHPGEKGDSHFPDGGTHLPRSAVIAIRRDDGEVIG
jgi:hypothetical protein